MTFPARSHVIAIPIKSGEAIFKTFKNKCINQVSIVLFSFFLALCFLVIAPAASAVALAQNNTTSQYNTPNLNPDVPRNQHTFAQSAMIETISTAFCLLTGIDPINPAQGCLDIDPQTHKLGLRPPQNGQPQIGGLMGFLPGMFSMVYTPPASSVDYVRYLANNFGIVQPAYAVNGFDALKPLQALWTVSRNITYFIFVLVFVVIGLGIMLRVKIDPRTVMTLQNQIPRIIIGILLITFSYAIAGLMIDGMWLLTYAGINVITQANPPQTNPAIAGCTPDTLQKRATQNLLSTAINFGNQVLAQDCHWYASGLNQITWEVSNAMGSIIGDVLKQGITGGTQQDMQCLAWKWPPVNFGACGALAINAAGTAIGYVVGFIAGIISFLIILIALFIALIRIWWDLLKAYVMIILYVITAPLFIILGLLPGRPLGFEKWLRRMFVHLVTFPAIAALLVTASILDKIFHNPNLSGSSFVPPLIGQPNMESLGSLLAFAIILICPSILEILQQNLSAASKGGQMAGNAINIGMAGGAAGPKALGNAIGSRVFGINQRTGEAGAGIRTLAGKTPGDGEKGSWRYRGTQLIFGKFDNPNLKK